MPSPESRGLGSAAALVWIAAFLAAFGTVVAVQRCRAMYFANDGLEGFEVRREKHPGVDDVVLARFRGETRQVDLEIAHDLRVTKTIDAGAWRNGEAPPPAARRFHLSEEAWGYAFLYPGLALFGLLLVLRPGPLGMRQTLGSAAANVGMAVLFLLALLVVLFATGILAFSGGEPFDKPAHTATRAPGSPASRASRAP